MTAKLFTFKNKRKFPGWLMTVIVWTVKAFAWSYRLTVEDLEGWLATKQPWPVLIAIWHEKILFLPALAPDGLLERMCVLISRSRDGEYVSDLVNRFHLRAVRGSSGRGRGGVQAVLELMEAIKTGYSPILTVDGPRGPRHCIHPGIFLLAEKSGAPIIPVTLITPHCWHFRSWDRTVFPVPFSKLILRFGKPFELKQDECWEDAALRLKETLENMETQASL